MLSLGKHICDFTPPIPGKVYVGSLYRSKWREGGYRIIVCEGSRLVYDTQDCFNLANAQNKFEQWLAERLAESARHQAEVDAVLSDAIWEKPIELPVF